VLSHGRGRSKLTLDRTSEILFLLICVVLPFRSRPRVVYLDQYFLQPLLQHDLCGRTSLASEPGVKVLHFDFVLYGRLLDKNSYRCAPLTDLSYLVVLLQGGESRGDRFIECLRGDTSTECSTSRRSLTATVHVRRTTCRSVTYSPFVLQSEQSRSYKPVRSE
jgi:hypothetical protein